MVQISTQKLRDSEFFGKHTLRPSCSLRLLPPQNSKPPHSPKIFRKEFSFLGNQKKPRNIHKQNAIILHHCGSPPVRKYSPRQSHPTNGVGPSQTGVANPGIPRGVAEPRDSPVAQRSGCPTSNARSLAQQGRKRSSGRYAGCAKNL